MRCKSIAAIGVAALLAGCSVLPEDDGPDYKKSATVESLAVPPELTAPSGPQALDIPRAGEAVGPEDARTQAAAQRTRREVLPEYENVEVRGRGDMRWLAVDEGPEAVWAALTRFWEQEGFALRMEEPELGIMETQWAENRADIPEGPIRGVIGSVFPNLYSAATRDKFRVRLERTDGGAEVYLTHYGVQEVSRGESELAWEPRPSDPELANEMLHRFLVHLGVKKAQAERMVAEAEAAEDRGRAELLHEGGRPVLRVRERFARAWRHTGIALDRLGFVVEDRNRQEGIYYVELVDLLEDADKQGGDGWFDWLFSSEDEAEIAGGQRFRVVLTDEGESTRIAIQDEAGEPLPADKADRILTRLQRQLR